MSTNCASPKQSCLVVAYGNFLDDPPTLQAMHSLRREGFEVHCILVGNGKHHRETEPKEITIHTVCAPLWLKGFGALNNWYRWKHFCSEVRRLLDLLKPELVITIMLHALAALPKRHAARRCRIVSCVYDIPAPGYTGRLDKRIIKFGWRQLQRANVVWSSDIYKAKLAQEFGQLKNRPLICHNCPALGYLPDPGWPRDGWLRAELRKRAATIGEAGGSILLRAGAVGECGGIEETLGGMRNLPGDYVFVLMGRPPEAYKRHLLDQIAKLGLQHRAFLFDRPSDQVWKQALQGADIGHLIHGPFPPGYMTRLYELNSSLSNNRLFQYMAAGLPIIAYDDPRMNELYAEVPCFRVARLAQLGTDIREAWHELGSDEPMRRELGNAGRSAHLTKYCWESQFAPILSALDHEAMRPV